MAPAVGLEPSGGLTPVGTEPTHNRAKPLQNSALRPIEGVVLNTGGAQPEQEECTSEHAACAGGVLESSTDMPEDLTRLAEAWPRLRAAARARIMEVLVAVAAEQAGQEVTQGQ